MNGTTEPPVVSGFGHLVEQEILPLQRYARALTRDRERADDLVQTCLTRALARQHLWQPGTALRAWLFTILHNAWVSLLRSAAREQARREITVALLTPAARQPDARLDLIDLDRAISKLPTYQRRILVLIALEGMVIRKRRQPLVRGFAPEWDARAAGCGPNSVDQLRQQNGATATPQ
jgi:RNA polymerase sigma-70 factor (ECF subfamily)